MRLRLIPAGLLLAGLVCIGTGTAFALTDEQTGRTVSAQARQPDGSADAKARLRQANLPLSFLGGGVGQLTDGSAQLDAGAHELSDGLGQARDGGGQLAEGLGRLDDGLGRLGAGAGQVSGGVDEVVDRLIGFGGMQASATSRLAALANTLDAQPGPVARDAAAQLRTLVGTLDEEGLGPETLDRLEQLRAGARQLAFELTDPGAEFVAGMAQASGGAAQLRDGLALLDDGGRALTDGTGRLTEGVEPVGEMVSGIAADVKAASSALTSARSTAPTPVETATTGDRAWWPFALIGAGAAALTAAAARGVLASRTAAQPAPAEA